MIFGIIIRKKINNKFEKYNYIIKKIYIIFIIIINIKKNIFK